jgi:hypothetical protein
MVKAIEFELRMLVDTMDLLPPRLLQPFNDNGLTITLLLKLRTQK